MTMYMIIAADGTRVYQGDKGTGMTKAQADADVVTRNKRAAHLGVGTTYKAVEFVSLANG